MRNTHTRHGLTAVWLLMVLSSGCGGGDEATDLHSPVQLMSALLTVDDVGFIPGLPDDFDDEQQWVEAPTAPWDGTLDPVLCSEDGLPTALTLPQAQAELAGINLMQVLISARDADQLFDELLAAYASCDESSSLPYAQLADAPIIGDESASYRCEYGLATVARFGNDLLILRWMVQADTDLAIPYYPQLLAVAGAKVTALDI